MQSEIGSNFWIHPNEINKEASVIKPKQFGCNGSDVIWHKAECSPVVDEDADYVYDHILCIPVDQRYDSDDMERIVTVLGRII